MAATIHVGVGGWDFDPWRGTFYPPGLAKAKQLAYLGTRLSATEINATFYKLQTPELFERWGARVPDGFRFAIKASRFCTNRKDLGEAGEAIGRFCAQGFTKLGDKLGPILWQLAPTKRFDADELRAFFMLLPPSRDGIALRHALEVRHESFKCREFVAMARAWAAGENPAGLDYVSDARAEAKLRDVFAFVISGAKLRNPAAAEALIGRLA